MKKRGLGGLLISLDICISLLKSYYIFVVFLSKKKDFTCKILRTLHTKIVTVYQF